MDDVKSPADEPAPAAFGIPRYRPVIGVAGRENVGAIIDDGVDPQPLAPPMDEVDIFIAGQKFVFPGEQYFYACLSDSALDCRAGRWEYQTT